MHASLNDIYIFFFSNFYSNKFKQKPKILTARSPEMLAPARIPVAAGKNTANTSKKP